MANNTKELPKKEDNLQEVVLKLNKDINPSTLRLISISDLEVVYQALYNPSGNKQIIDASTILKNIAAKNKIV